MESFPQAMQDKPSRLLGNSKIAVNLVGANAILAASQHPEGQEPLLQRDRRILKDGLNLDGKLATAVTTLPALLCLEIVGVFSVLADTVRAPWTLEPAHRGYRINADLFVAKVLNCFL
jgi:hypothetical protein